MQYIKIRQSIPLYKKIFVKKDRFGVDFQHSILRGEDEGGGERYTLYGILYTIFRRKIMSKLVSILYKLARAANDISKVASGDPKKIARRAKNKIVGKKLNKTLGKFLWK